MAQARQSFKIVAYAGAGKTTTLSLIGQHLQGKGLYLAFNKAIATEAAGKFANHIDCRTFHSLAYRFVNRNITKKLSLPRYSPNRLAQAFALQTLQARRLIDGRHEFVRITPARQASLISDAVSNFCRTHASYPAPRHLNLPEWLAESDAEELREQLYPWVEQRWQQAIDPNHGAGIGHEIYLKLWALAKPRIPADFILFDEAQDADPLMLGILLNQGCQVIYVGDAHQQIYEWRGATNAMKRLPLPETLLTQSFRFGDAIADVANLLLQGLQESVPLKGNPDKPSQLGLNEHCLHKDAILCRTNANAMSRLMTGLRLGHKVALQADTQRLLRFSEAAERLKRGQQANGVPELAYFYTWQDVQEYCETNEGSDLKTLVRLIDDHGSQALKQAINALSDINQADYVISTAHKAKGLEWANVQLDDDFQFELGREEIHIRPEELRLLYVACTRAKQQLNIHHIRPLISGLKKGDAIRWD